MNGLNARLQAVLERYRVLVRAEFARLEVYLVDDYRDTLRWSSVRLNLAMIVLNAIFAAMPELDPHIAAIFPQALQSPVIGIYATIALALRVTKMKANG